MWDSLLNHLCICCKCNNWKVWKELSEKSAWISNQCFAKNCFESKADKGCSLDSNPGNIEKSLSFYDAVVCITEDSALLSKIKLFTFFHKIMGLIHLKLLKIWHFIIVRHLPIHQNTHHKTLEAVCTVHINLYCARRRAIFYTCINIVKKSPHTQILFTLSILSLSVDTSYAGWQTKTAAIIDFECWK